MKVALYARVSSERQAEKDLSIPAQLKALRRYALERGWQVVAEYVDEAESARSANRPEFKQMVAAARRKSKPEGMIEVIDEFYSTNLSEDTLRGMRENAERGFSNGGHAPFGYRRIEVNIGGVEKSRLGPDEGEAVIAKRAFQMSLAGEGGKDIAKAWNSEGLRTRTGKLWGSTTINYMLRNEVYTGTLVWTGKNGETIRTPNAHPALISIDDFHKVQQLLTERQPKVRHPRTVTSQYLLSSLLYCAKCKAPMIGCGAKSGHFFYYRCNSALRRGPEACQSGWIPKSKIESFVVDRLKEKVLTEDNLSELVRMVNEEIGLLAGRRRERLEDIEKQLESLNQKLLKYYLAFERGTMTDDDAAPRVRELRAEQTRLQRSREEALAEQEDTQPKGLDTEEVLRHTQDLKVLLAEGTLTEQNAFLRSFIRRIDLGLGKVAIDYTIPMPTGKDRTSEREVLSIERLGSPGWIRTNNLAVNSRPLYH